MAGMVYNGKADIRRIIFCRLGWLTGLRITEAFLCLSKQKWFEAKRKMPKIEKKEKSSWSSS